MKTSQFLESINYAGFEVEKNRVALKSEFGASLKDVLFALGYSSCEVDNGRGKKFIEYRKEDCDFRVNIAKENPSFATVDAIE